jgi:hypothetical protein
MILQIGIEFNENALKSTVICTGTTADYCLLVECDRGRTAR